MKNALYALLFLMTLGSCKKAIEKAQENAVVNAITTGYWKVTKYVKGATEVTNDFSSYKFQFNENNTVDAVKNNSLELSGSWQADAVSRTIEANFINASVPLSLLNGNWTITNSTWTSVDATMTVNGENRRLVLNKE